MSLLSVHDLTKNFGGLQVVDSLAFEVSDGEILSIIGPNGAGKTTVLNLLTGTIPADGGTMEFESQSLAGLRPHQITKLGIGRTFQTLRLFLNMSVIENVMAAAYSHTRAGLLPIILRTKSWRMEEQRIRALAEETLSFFGERLVGYRFDQPAYSLSYANRRRLEIARAMAIKPKLLLLDEPAAGMNPKETIEMTELIGELRDKAAQTIIFIEHDMKVVAGISDRVIALDYGQKIAEGSFDEVTSNERVIEAYLGRRHQPAEALE